MVKLKEKTKKCWLICLVGCLSILFMVTAGHAKQETVKVGVVAAMKFLQGKHTWGGATIAAEEINEAGGVKVGDKTYKIELIKADSNEWASIADATSALERVITVDKVKMVLGGYRSEAVLAMQDVAAEYKTIYFSVGAGHSQIPGRVKKDYDTYKYWFREGQPFSLWGGYVLLGILDDIKREYKETLGIEKPKVAILAEKVMWADQVCKIMEKMVPEKLGLEIVGAWHPSHAANDLRAELNAIKSAGAHIIIDLVSGPVGIAVGRQWGGLKIPAALAGYNGEAQKREYWDATDKNCEYEAMIDYIAPLPINKRNVTFWKKFTERYKTYPMNTALAYNCLWIWKEAVERAGTFDPEKVIPEIEKTNFKGVGGTYRYHPPGHNLAHDIVWGPDAFTEYGTQWRNGEKKVIWPDGNPLLGDTRWKGVRFEGTVDYELPPWVITYWEKNK
jgi:branched-chain amino acid transport system substrate-binding protein